MNKIIVLSGKQFSGKDTVAKILVDKLDGFSRVGIGDSIKIEYGAKNNLSFDEIEKNKHLYRSDLIELGNWGRNISDDYWLKKISDMDNIIVPDVRVKFEVNFFKNQGAFLIRVESLFEARSKRGVIVKSDDLTETDLDDYCDWDYIIENNSSLDDLIQKVDKLVEKINTFYRLR